MDFLDDPDEFYGIVYIRKSSKISSKTYYRCRKESKKEDMDEKEKKEYSIMPRKVKEIVCKNCFKTFIREIPKVSIEKLSDLFFCSKDCKTTYKFTWHE